MIRIAFLLPNLAFQGPIIVVHDLIIELQKKGCYCECFYFKDWVEIELPCNCTKISFFKYNDFCDFNLIHSHMLKPDIYVAIFRLNKKTITTIHQFFFESLSYQYGWLSALAIKYIWVKSIRKIKTIVAISESLQLNLQNNCRLKNVYKVYNGIGERYAHTSKLNSEKNIQKLLNFKNNSVLIGVTSLLIRRKGISLIINAMKFLPNFKLCIIGDGSERANLIKIATEINVVPNVIFMGFQKDATSYLKYFDLFVTASYSEGFGLSLMEAAYAGLPCVCSPISVFQELFTTEEVVFFENFDSKSISNAIEIAYQKRIELSVAIKKAYDRKFTAEIMAKNYLHLYSQLLQKK